MLLALSISSPLSALLVRSGRTAEDFFAEFTARALRRLFMACVAVALLFSHACFSQALAVEVDQAARIAKEKELDALVNEFWVTAYWGQKLKKSAAETIPANKTISNIVPLELQKNLMELEALEKNSPPSSRTAFYRWNSIAKALLAQNLFADTAPIIDHSVSLLSSNPAARPLRQKAEHAYTLSAYFIGVNRPEDALSVVASVLPELEQALSDADFAKAESIAWAMRLLSLLNQNLGYAHLQLGDPEKAYFGHQKATRISFELEGALNKSRGRPDKLRKAVAFGDWLEFLVTASRQRKHAEEVIEGARHIASFMEDYGLGLDEAQMITAMSAVVARAHNLRGRYQAAEALTDVAINYMRSHRELYERSYHGGERMYHTFLMYMALESMRSKRAQKEYAEAIAMGRLAIEEFDWVFRNFGRRELDYYGEEIAEELLMAATAAGESAQPPSNVTHDLFKHIQRVQRSSIALASSLLRDRYSAAETDLASLIRRRQDILASRELAMTQFGKSLEHDDVVSPPPSRIAELDVELARIDETLSSQYPEYEATTGRLVVSIDSIRESLNEDEALLTWSIGTQGSGLLVIRKNGERWIRLSANSESVSRSANQLNRLLTPTGNGLQPFPAGASFELFRQLFGDGGLAALRDGPLAGVRHLYLLPHPSFGNLPLATLLTSRSSGSYFNPDQTELFRNAPWLIREFSMTTLPSAASLNAYAATRPHTQPSTGLLGIGAPSFRKHRQADLARNQGLRGVSINVADISALEELPEAEKELKKIAELFDPKKSTLLLGDDASETKTRAMPLNKFAVLAFATHGLLANELPGQIEPALVLSPPAVPSANDDGLLTASEIATLKLDADLVILSACNTAAGDGKIASEGLSGLARSFMYAGARNLLVSNWAVISEATEQLITRTMSLARDQKQHPSNSLRLAMLEMISSRDAILSHPSAWAGFIFVGGGSQGQQAKPAF